MSGVAGYKAQLKLGGVPTIFNDEPLEKILGSNRIFTIDEDFKRVLSANHGLQIYDANDLTVTTPRRVNYLEGIIFFDTDPSLDFTLPLTATGACIPLLFIGGSKDYSLEIGGDVLDDTSFHSETDLCAGYRTKVCGIHDIKATVGKWNDFGGKLTAPKLAKTPVFLKINPGGSNTSITGWFHIETDTLSGDVGALEEEAVSLVLSGNNTKTYFSYCYDYYNYTGTDVITEDMLIANYFFE